MENALDVVTMRQEVRQLARDLGLGLIPQAKISTAVSTIARALITAQGSTTLSLQADERAARPALNITWPLSSNGTPEHLAHLEQVIQFDSTRSLVDEASLISDSHGALLTLRMWLNR